MNESYENIKRRVSERYERRMGFAIHLVTFVATAVIFWGVLGWATSVLLQVIGALWFAGLLGHGVQVLFEELRDRALERGMEKAKRSPERRARSANFLIWY